jgi:hypothetical protein
MPIPQPAFFGTSRQETVILGWGLSVTAKFAVATFTVVHFDKIISPKYHSIILFYNPSIIP